MKMLVDYELRTHHGCRESKVVGRLVREELPGACCNGAVADPFLSIDFPTRTCSVLVSLSILFVCSVQ